MGKLTIQEVAKVLAQKNGLEQREANRFAAQMFDVILQALQRGEQVKVKGLGTFKIINVEARESVSVRTGERVVIDSHSKVTFTPDTIMKELVNKPFSQFETVVLNDGVEFEDMPEDPTEEETEPVTVAEEPVVKVEESVAVEKPMTVVEESVAVEEQAPAAVVEAPVAEAPAEEEPVVVEEQEPIVVEEQMPAAVVEEPAALAKTQEPKAVEGFVTDDDPETSHWGWWLLAAFSALLLMVLSGWGGYEYGRRQQPVVPDTVVVTDTFFMAELDTLDAEPLLTEPVAMEEPEPQPVVKEEPKPQPQAEVVDKWAAKDERVRLGAYRIVGTAEEVTVQAGQTFYSICRAHLGPDMQCYVEVYNNLPQNPQIKEGQVIKIPKLELKKRKRN